MRRLSVDKILSEVAAAPAAESSGKILLLLHLRRRLFGEVVSRPPVVFVSLTDNFLQNPAYAEVAAVLNSRSF